MSVTSLIHLGNLNGKGLRTERDFMLWNVLWVGVIDRGKNIIPESDLRKELPFCKSLCKLVPVQCL